MNFDGTINLGTIIQTGILIFALIAGWNALKAELKIFENTLDGHTKLLTLHSKRMDKYEERAIELVGDIQRLIGIVGKIDQKKEK